MAGLLPVQQQYGDVREGEKPGEGIAFAGGVNLTALMPSRARIWSNTVPSARRISISRIERLARDAERVTYSVEANHPGYRAESAIRYDHINRRARDDQRLARLILTVQSVKSTNPARNPMTSTVRP